MAKSVERGGRATNEPPDAESIEVEVESKLEPVLANLSKVQREQILSRVMSVVRTEMFAGPLPHPRHLEEYERILPGGADRIFAMTEKTIDSNIAVNERGQRYDHYYRLLGMGLGFSALLLLIGGAIYSGLNGHLDLAALLMGATALGVIGVFVNAHIKR